MSAPRTNVVRPESEHKNTRSGCAAPYTHGHNRLITGRKGRYINQFACARLQGSERPGIKMTCCGDPSRSNGRLPAQPLRQLQLRMCFGKFLPNPSEDMPAASSAINNRSFPSVVLLPLPGNMDISLVLPGQKSSYRSIRKREEIRGANDTHVQAMHSPCTLRRFVKFAEQEFELHF
jgi:hypothetical protein